MVIVGQEHPHNAVNHTEFLSLIHICPEPEYTTPMNVILGLSDAYRAGKRLKLPRYEEFGVFAQELMARMRECIERDRRTTPEGIPYVPLSIDVYKRQILPTVWGRTCWRRQRPI